MAPPVLASGTARRAESAARGTLGTTMTVNVKCLILLAGAALACSAALTGGAAGQTAAQQNAIREHCRNDFMSHCSGVSPGGKAALSCLQKNVAELSPACEKAVSATMPTPHPKAAGRPAPAAPAPAARAPAAPSAAKIEPVPGGVLIEKACLRYILRHCRGMGLDMARKVACLADYVNRGNFVGPRCKTALRISGHLR